MVRNELQIEEDVARLRNWLSKQPHLPQDLDNEFLSAYVHGTKSLEIAKQKLDGYFTSKAKAPHLFGFPARDASDAAFQEASEALKIFFIPKVTEDRHLLLMITFDKDFSKFDHDQYVVRLMMMIELALLRWPYMEGVTLAVDVGGMDSSLLTKLTPATAVFFIQWFQRAIPMRLKRAIIFNTPSFFEIVINRIFKPVLSKKLFDRILLTSEDQDILSKHIPVELLPSDFGGEQKPSDDLNDYWLNELERNRDWFLTTSKQLADESRRPADVQDAFSINGTFRCLSID